WYRKNLSPQHIFSLASWLTLALAVITSFSRAVYVGAIVLPLLLVFLFRVRIAHVSLISFIIILLFLPLLQARFSDTQDRATPERARGYSWWQEILTQYPVWRGAGPGQYPLALENHLNQEQVRYEAWEIAPVHSVPLLLAAEWGMIGGGFLLGYALFCLLRRDWQNIAFWLLPILPALLRDHYFLTQNAPLVFLMVLGLLHFQPAKS
ncbi:MAG: hypothetical protein AAB538_02495, partial [Patescibacteria group bacterium]